jgi:hypothetical protein
LLCSIALGLALWALVDIRKRINGGKRLNAGAIDDAPAAASTSDEAEPDLPEEQAAPPEHGAPQEQATPQEQAETRSSAIACPRAAGGHRIRVVVSLAMLLLTVSYSVCVPIIAPR